MDIIIKHSIPCALQKGRVTAQPLIYLMYIEPLGPLYSKDRCPFILGGKIKNIEKTRISSEFPTAFRVDFVFLWLKVNCIALQKKNF